MAWVVCTCSNGNVPVSFPHNGELQTIWEPCPRCNGRGGWFAPDAGSGSDVGGRSASSGHARSGDERFSWGWAVFGVLVGLVVVGGLDTPFWPTLVVSALVCGVFHKTVGILVSIGVIAFFCWIFTSASKAKKEVGPAKSSSRAAESAPIGGSVPNVPISTSPPAF